MKLNQIFLRSFFESKLNDFFNSVADHFHILNMLLGRKSLDINKSNLISFIYMLILEKSNHLKKQ